MRKNISKELVYWNKKLHIHLGLFMLLFIWLFSLSGLLLNHSNWKFASFYEQRKENKTTTRVTVPANLDSASIIKQVVKELKISAEVREVKLNKDSMDFRAEVPGHIRNIHVDFKTGLCTQKEMRFNGSGVIRTMHTFNGVDKNNPASTPNWLLTWMWRLTMDGIAIGLIFLCISSYIMWYKLKQGRLLGSILLIAGLIGAAYFVFLIRMM